MDRRSLLTLAGMAALGCGMEACAPWRGGTADHRVPLALTPVQVSWDRVLRTTVGLRPHRAAGFLLQAQQIDATTVIHNVGHGGAGMSLTWGTASMAADLALEHTQRRAAVLGSGVAGLSSARELQQRGFRVTIYAATLPPHTTSNMSLAAWTPASGVVEWDQRTPAWDAQFRQAARIAYRRLQLLIGPTYGVSRIMNYIPTDNSSITRGSNDLLPQELESPSELLQPGEHPFATTYCIAREGLRIEPSIYLDALIRDFRHDGGTVVVRRLDTLRDVVALPESLIVNCTGLGSRALFGDRQLQPIKGQLVVLAPQPEVNYATSGGLRSGNWRPGASIYMMPRSDGIILGGTAERDVWTLAVNEPERTRVVEAHSELFSAMRAATQARHSGGTPRLPS